MTVRTRHGVEIAFVLPPTFAGVLLIGVIAVATHASADTVAALAAVLVVICAAVADRRAALPVAGLGWVAFAAFARPPYGDLSVQGKGWFAGLMAFLALSASACGQFFGRSHPTRTTLVSVATDNHAPGRRGFGVLETLPDSRSSFGKPNRSSGVSRRRVLWGLALAGILLPALTLGLTQVRGSLALIDALLIYLLAVQVVTLVGGFWPSLLAACAADLLLNWYFTVPYHHWTIEKPADLFALLLFVATAITVSSVVHLAARRSHAAAQRAAEARALLDLARTVLSGDDSPDAVLDHLRRTSGLAAQLQERHGEGWLPVAGNPGPGRMTVSPAGETFRLVAYRASDGDPPTARLLPAYAAQAVAACERQRLRIQANQAEGLAEGNRMRTALLAAVSHDLRSPLASVKAAVSTLRQTDIVIDPADRAALLATIEDGADRLDGLISNLLDMSRIQVGAVQPMVRAVSVEEIAPLLVRGVDGGHRVHLDIPDGLPLVRADVGLLERALANVLSNALRYSPAGRPPTIGARTGPDDRLVISVVDHGPGVPAEARGRIFAPFQQLGDSPTTDGVGLGLAVARGFVEAMGGSIEAADTPGGGLTMHLSLPVARPLAAVRR